MKKNIFAVCDLETSYAYNLMEYIYEKQGSGFEIQAFTSVKSLSSFAKEQDIELLLISAQAMCNEVKELPIGRIMILSEGELIEELSEYPAIYKYQASDSLIAEVMDLYAAEKAPSPQLLLKKKVEILGVYSPIKRTLKTSFALTLGQILAKEKAVLYINLEDYAGFESLMGKEFQSNISDLMYFARQDSGNLIYKLSAMVHNLGNLDYIPPVFSPQDIRSVTLNEWLMLLEQIQIYSTYDTIIIDFGDLVDELYELINRCDRIYMPVREDSISIAKLEQYESVLRIGEYEEILGKTKKLKMPFHNSFGNRESYVEQLIWGELGDFVRKLIREEEKNDK